MLFPETAVVFVNLQCVDFNLWTSFGSRFHVKIEPLKEKLDPSMTVKGVEYIDVPANGKKDYKLAFFAYREGITPVKVYVICKMFVDLCFEMILLS